MSNEVKFRKNVKTTINVSYKSIIVNFEKKKLTTGDIINNALIARITLDNEGTEFKIKLTKVNYKNFLQ